MPRKTTKEVQEVLVEEQVDQYVDHENEIGTAEYEAAGLAKISKDIKKSVVGITKPQLRALVDAYYQAQADRIAKQNKLRSFAQLYDTESEKVKNSDCTALDWLYQDAANREAQIQAMLMAYAKSHPVTKWMMDIVGIGPLIATQTFAYIDMDACPKAANLISYCGLNDNNIKWLGAEKGGKLAKEAYESAGLKTNKKITPDVVAYVVNATGRNPKSIYSGIERMKNAKKKNKDQAKTSDFEALKSYLAQPPYNKRFKLTTYFIECSIQKCCNKPKSLYGKLYKERKAYEMAKNMNKDYADQAAYLLATKNYSKNTTTYKSLSEGMLSDAHIDRRALRWTCKILMNHVFEAMYTYTYKKQPPEVYVVAHMGHTEYIPPEVDYSYLKDID